MTEVEGWEEEVDGPGSGVPAVSGVPLAVDVLLPLEALDDDSPDPLILTFFKRERDLVFVCCCCWSATAAAPPSPTKPLLRSASRLVVEVACKLCRLSSGEEEDSLKGTDRGRGAIGDTGETSGAIECVQMDQTDRQAGIVYKVVKSNLDSHLNP